MNIVTCPQTPLCGCWFCTCLIILDAISFAISLLKMRKQKLRRWKQPVGGHTACKSGKLGVNLSLLSPVSMCFGFVSCSLASKKGSEQSTYGTGELKPEPLTGHDSPHWELLGTLSSILPWWLRWWSVCLQCGRPGFNPWVRKISWRRKWQSTPVFNCSNLSVELNKLNWLHFHLSF